MQHRSKNVSNSVILIMTWSAHNIEEKVFQQVKLNGARLSVSAKNGERKS
jgi:hypothetical protein